MDTEVLARCDIQHLNGCTDDQKKHRKTLSKKKKHIRDLKQPAISSVCCFSRLITKFELFEISNSTLIIFSSNLPEPPQI